MKALVFTSLLSSLALLAASSQDDGNSWTHLLPTSPDLPHPSSVGAVMAEWQDSLFVFGGLDNGVYKNEFWMFEVEGSNDWKQLAPGPMARYMASSCRVIESDGKAVMYVLGGEVSKGNLTNTMVGFDLTNSSSDWFPITPAKSNGSPSPRYGHAMVGMDAGSHTLVIMFGGVSIVNETPLVSNELWSFNTDTKVWSRMSTFKPSARFGHAMLNTADGNVLLFGGTDCNGTYYNDLWMYTKSSHKWSTVDVTYAPSTRAFVTAGFLNGSMVLFGGADDTTVHADMYILDGETLKWARFKSESKITRRWGAVSWNDIQSKELFMFGGKSTVGTGPDTSNVGSELWELHVGDKCGLYTDCDKCTRWSATCGWCAVTQTCVEGSAGAGSSTCPRGFYFDACPTCGQSSACGSCVNQDNCVWCETHRDCVEGDIQGPFSGTCDHQYDSEHSCPDCESHTSCSTCQAQEQCGWCFGNGTCSAGTGNGPFYAPTCASQDAWWWDETCPACEQFDGDCDTCAAAEHCGYCQITGKCLAGTQGSSFDTTCTRSFQFTAPCPQCQTEYSKLSCRRCTNRTSEGAICGWCDEGIDSMERPFCAVGDEKAPFKANCPTNNWIIEINKCSSCTQNFVCDTCILDPSCVWCNQYGGYCMSTNSTRALCDEGNRVTDKCSPNKPSWDPSGWNSRNDYQDVALAMGIIAVLTIFGLVGASVWWKRQSRKRMKPEPAALERDRSIPTQTHQERYIYRNSRMSESPFMAFE